MITIFVLGIIAMIMILGLTFLTTATLEKKAAINYNNSVKADFTAKTALNRAIQLIKIYSVSPVADYSHIMSFDNPTKRISTPDFPTPISLTQKEYDILTHDLDKMSTTTNGIEYYKYVKGDKSKPLTWIYLRDEVDGPIVSRMAFIVIPPQTPKSPEKYWIDDKKQPSATGFYHRFNLTRTDWNSFNNKIAPLKNPPVPFSETDKEIINKGGIPWLKNWKSKGGFDTPKQCKNQIMANLIDYSDSDSNATTDDENAPTYVGLERVPYINEVQVEFDPWIKITKTNGTRNKSRYSVMIDINVTVELINMYYKLSNQKYKDVRVTVKMDYEFSVGNKPNTGVTSFTDYVMPTITTSKIILNSNNEHIVVSKKLNFPSDSNLPNYIFSKLLPRNIFIEKLKIRKLTVKFESEKINPKTNKKDFYDFATVFNGNRQININRNVTSGGTTQKGDNKFYFNAEVDDPRQNTRSVDWKTKFDGTNSLNANNSICQPMPPQFTERDLEISNSIKPWEVSTAYIRNAPMKSPWELGFIHRGEKWQTINLKKFNTKQGAKADGGGNGYIDGDANILNQIKMTNDRETSDKTDINSDNIDVLKTMFEEIYVGSFEKNRNKRKLKDMDPNYNTINKINSYRPKELATRLSKLYDKDNPFKSRAEILSDSLNGNVNEFRRLVTGDDNYLYLGQNNDAEKEEIIGKFINKATTTTSNSGTLNIIAMGESIKDLGNVTIGSKTGKKGVFDIGVDKILASEKIFVVMRSKKNPDPKIKYPIFYISKFKYVN